jgi:hypothetical protein
VLVMVFSLVATVVCSVSVVLFAAGNDARGTTVLQLSELLGGGYDLGGGVAWGSAMGLHVVVTFGDGGRPNLPERWTQIVVTLPQDIPLFLHVRPRPPEDAPAGALSFAATPFEQLFLVEGAPSDVVRYLLDDELRAALLLRRGEVELTAESGSLTLSCHGWLEEIARTRSAIELAAWIANRIPEAYDAAERGAHVNLHGAPYRAEYDAFLAERTSASRQDEVRALVRRRSGLGRRVVHRLATIFQR